MLSLGLNPGQLLPSADELTGLDSLRKLRSCNQSTQVYSSVMKPRRVSWPRSSSLDNLNLRLFRIRARFGTHLLGAKLHEVGRLEVLEVCDPWLRLRWRRQQQRGRVDGVVHQAYCLVLDSVFASELLNGLSLSCFQRRLGGFRTQRLPELTTDGGALVQGAEVKRKRRLLQTLEPSPVDGPLQALVGGVGLKS